MPIQEKLISNVYKFNSQQDPDAQFSYVSMYVMRAIIRVSELTMHLRYRSNAITSQVSRPLHDSMFGAQVVVHKPGRVDMYIVWQQISLANPPVFSNALDQLAGRDRHLRCPDATNLEHVGISALKLQAVRTAHVEECTARATAACTGIFPDCHLYTTRLASCLCLSAES